MRDSCLKKDETYWRAANNGKVPVYHRTGDIAFSRPVSSLDLAAAISYVSDMGI